MNENIIFNQYWVLTKVLHIAQSGMITLEWLPLAFYEWAASQTDKNKTNRPTWMQLYGGKETSKL